jgi:HOMODA hydrolase
MALNKRNVDAVPTRESVLARMQWLMHPSNHHLLAEELVDLRLRIYLAPETRAVAPKINAVIQRHDDFLIPLEALRCETLFLWTADNPIHDLEAARAAAKRVPGSLFHLMRGHAAHWPQYECPDEFNAVTTAFFRDGRLTDSAA